MVPNCQNWEQKLFKSVLKLDRGSSPRPIVDFMTDADDGVNWIKIGDTKKGELYINSTKEKITPEGAKKSRKVSKGEIIVSNSMSYGQPYILNIDGYIHDGWFVIRNYEKHFEKNYLLQFLGSELIQRQYKRLAAGGVVSNISSDLVYAVKATIPPLPEQRKIAQILSTWDRGIATTEKLIDASKQQKKALMQQLLTGKKRLIDPETGKAFQGEWEEVKLKAITQFIKDGTHGTHKRYDKGVPMLSAANITKNHKVNFEGAPNISHDDYNKIHSKYEINEGDILLTVVGTLGRVALVPKAMKFTLQRSVAIIRTSNKASNQFLMQVFSSKEFNNLLISKSNSTAQAGVYLGELAKIKLLLPSLEEQQKVASVLTAADKEIELLEAKLAHLKQEKKALMQQLLTGKRRVQVSETEAA